MPRRPLQFHLANLPNPLAVEAAARRRMRAMENAFPAVLDWDLRVGMPEAAGEGACFTAIAQARVVGGATLRAQAQAADALGAVRLAFNGLDAELEAEREEARNRAADWLSAVRRRIAQHRVGREPA